MLFSGMQSILQAQYSALVRFDSTHRLYVMDYYTKPCSILQQNLSHRMHLHYLHTLYYSQHKLRQEDLLSR